MILNIFNKGCHLAAFVVIVAWSLTVKICTSYVVGA